MTGERQRLLVVAYSCAPGRGSEPGAGWGLVHALAEFADVVALVGSEGMAAIRKHEDETAGLEFVEVADTPLGRRLRGRRLGNFVAYLAWQRRARHAATELLRDRPFDAAVHATYSALWLPSLAVDLGLPTVWGPVGGGVTTPRPLWRLLGMRGMIGEVVDALAVRVAALWPGTRRTWRGATVRLVQNRESLRLLPRDLGSSAVLLNHALFHQAPPVAPSAARGDYVLWASMQEARKGPELAIRGLKSADPAVKMIMLGDGPERSRMELLAQKLGVSDRVDFAGKVPREEALRLMVGARAVVFTGLREEGGLALAEAMLLGCPVVVLDHGGAGLIARSTVDWERVALVDVGTVAQTVTRFGSALTQSWFPDSDVRTPLLDRATAIAQLRSAVTAAVAGPTK